MLTSHSFTVDPPGRIDFGEGAVQRVGAAVDSLGKGRAFVVTDTGIVRAGIIDVVRQALAEAGIEVDAFTEVEPNPSMSTVHRATEQARRFGDAAVVAVGGGSCLDAAKGIALSAAGPDPTLSSTSRLVRRAPVCRLLPCPPPRERARRPMASG